MFEFSLHEYILWKSPLIRDRACNAKRGKAFSQEKEIGCNWHVNTAEFAPIAP